MKNINSNTFIDPNLLYTPNSLAAAMEVDEEWIKRRLIYNRSCRFKKSGNCYLILGRWVIEWVEKDHTYPGKDDEDEG